MSCQWETNFLQVQLTYLLQIRKTVMMCDHIGVEKVTDIAQH